MKMRYKFSHSDATGRLHWYSNQIPGDSRVEHVSIKAEEFWDPPVCASRGPRIGDEGKPVCKRPPGHKGLHKPRPDDGWGQDMAWGDPW